MECAVWYMDHGSIRVEVFEDEHKAARFAADFEDYTLDGVVLGVQFKDGRIIDVTRETWPAMEEAAARSADAQCERAAAAPPDQRQRLASPFGGEAEVFASDDLPGWLGERRPW